MTKFKAVMTFATVLGLAAPAFAEAPLNIGFIVPNPIGEVGWDYELDRGRREMQEHFGDKIIVTAVDSVGEGPDSTRVMNRIVAQGADVLFLGSFGHMNDGLALAKRRPDLAVLHAGGYLNEANFATYSPKHYEAAYLCGMAAGYATKNGQLGIVAAFPLPEVLGIMNAYVLGAKNANPEIKDAKVVWLNSWFDPARNRASAESLVAQGADVLFSLFPGTPAAVAAAEELGVYVTTTLSDNSEFAPSKHLCAGQVNFSAIYIDQVNKVLNGSFEGVDIFAGVAEGAVEVAGLSDDLSEDQRAAIFAKQEAIRSGEFKPFSGPIVDNTGNEVVAAGNQLDAGMIKGMNFLVEGIDSELPY
ncbi:BMP family ABC transporter substrate-binding protein [Leisingera sp.]|uniref:BMP family ABC transporter substrate-binding protein n=1 Tax=Leisingera sp. TaxID=1879318 RepID=UPI002B27046B|nr:BMP family ABC transporter substrate-binding protein [Leisingera sp.]